MLLSKQGGGINSIKNFQAFWRSGWFVGAKSKEHKKKSAFFVHLDSPFFRLIDTKTIAGTPRKIVISKYDNRKIFRDHTLFSNEIGRTPEEAIRNSLTF